MSLIESALAKARKIAGDSEPQASAKSRRSTLRSSLGKRPAPAAPTAVATPIEPIHATPLPINFKICQEYRVLLDETAKNNANAVAAYRILRTRILQRARMQQWTTIGVTSATPNDGKSLTTLNLSLSLARERNSEVVLLDLDMRNPSMCKYLGIEPRYHLCNYLEGRANAQDVFFSIGVENLSIAAGTIRTELASELLGNAKLEELIQYIKQHTRNPIVLVDLPPLLSTDDALVVVPKIDAILLVAAEGRTDRTALDKAVELLTDVPLAGLVLNQAVETVESYDYGYGPVY